MSKPGLISMKRDQSEVILLELHKFCFLLIHCIDSQPPCFMNNTWISALHLQHSVTLPFFSHFAQITWPATPSKRDECKWAGKDLGVSPVHTHDSIMIWTLPTVPASVVAQICAAVLHACVWFLKFLWGLCFFGHPATLNMQTTMQNRSDCLDPAPKSAVK